MVAAAAACVRSSVERLECHFWLAEAAGQGAPGEISGSRDRLHWPACHHYRAVKELLSLDTPYLEAYLIRGGGLLGAAPGASVGPLSAGQVAHVEVLARFYISRHEYAKAAQVRDGCVPFRWHSLFSPTCWRCGWAESAACLQHTLQQRQLPALQVYELLADRASGPGEQAVSLEQREEHYQAAVLQVRA